MMKIRRSAVILALMLTACSGQNAPHMEEMTTTLSVEETTAANTEEQTEKKQEQQTDGLIIEDGMLHPILEISDPRDPAYTNTDSDILRYCVYVETDYDTDGDGMDDLVKVFMQVPKPAAEGKYKAGTIYDPTPYGAGTVEAVGEGAEPLYNETPFDYSKLYVQGQKRTPTDAVTTADMASDADSSDWNYMVPGSGEIGYTYADMYDYYLVRGYAVAECSGIGTYGSEGFELCGTDIERDCHKAVVEWLNGKRVAYSDREGTHTVEADFSNGRVAMTGASYGGTLPYEVATTGVEGLETIIPIAGIANWYDYTNSQGISTLFETHYTDFLSGLNSGGTFIDDDWTVPDDEYGSYLWQTAQDQNASNGDYSDAWAKLDYSHDYADIRCSALVVQGLNDFNVTTKQADLMMKAFDAAGANAKLLLHQDGHNFLDNTIVNGELWQDIMNKWLAHYLYDVDNGIENMPKVTVQSNVDGSFTTYDSWQDAAMTAFTVQSTDPDAVTIIDTRTLAEYAYQYLTAEDSDIAGRNRKEVYYPQLGVYHAAHYIIDVPEGTKIMGTPEIHVKMATPDVDKDGLMVTAVLTDYIDGEQNFKAYMIKHSLSENLPVRTTDRIDMGGGLGESSIHEYVQSNTPYKSFSYGWTDLNNPACGSHASEYTAQDPLVRGQYYDYTFYMQPTAYTIEPGHKLMLTITAWDPYRSFLDEDYEMDPENYTQYNEHKYSFNIDNSSVSAELPVVK